MPKIVDHDARRAAMVESAWDLISSRGIEAASLRNVANHMGVSKASLNHYFESQSQILSMCIQDMNDTILADAQSIGLENLDEQKVVRVFMLVIPSTPDRRRQAALWLHLLSLYGPKSTRPAMRQSTSVTKSLKLINERVHAGILLVLGKMQEQEMLPSDENLEVQADVLHALLDGLSLQVMTDPGHMTLARAKAAVRAHVRSMMVGVSAQARR